MAYSYRTFDSELELVDYLNDIVLGKNLEATKRVYGLHGKTVIVNDGVGDRTATFSDPNGEGLLPKQIVDQIQAAHANLATSVTLRSYAHNAPPQVQIAVVTATYTVKGAATANADLGLPGSDTVVGAAAVAKADIVSVNRGEGNRITVIHE